ncbi:helix-turn-helix domain-containing protein [Reinekea blandensis]|uniref:Transcriptional regulator PobR, AraC family protein n=1 Tax=Reinekea blandensis MED297 TaxID=314283 RepID=A4BGY3_9GAMM|nr:helix-turn-helix domain-containing protein [Reinekea blandensis]EAR08629.1 transcriptional regulator PobR, AraC family protein [Reinekea sp. MED297] [Reinekea blandensis MED297]
MTDISDANTVPIYGLYGERLGDTEPGFVHIESIAERSSQQGWHIRSHRHHNMIQLIIMTQGSVDILLDNQQRSLSGHGLIYIPNEVVHGFHFEPDTTGHVLSVATPFLTDIQTLLQTEVNPAWSLTPAVVKLHSSSELVPIFIHLRELLVGEFRQQKQYSHALLKCLLGALFTTFARTSNIAGLQTGSDHHIAQLQRFIALIDDHYKEHLRLDWYAGELGISLSTLNRICQSLLNQSGKKLIEERLVLEAKRRLIYTLDSVENIAFSLGFDDPAYFSRFFTKNTELSPGRYRRQHAQTSSV